MSLLTELQTDIAEVIQELGRQLTFTRKNLGNSSTFSSMTLKPTDSADTTYTVYACPDSYNSFEVDGKAIEYSDIKLIIEYTATYAPQTGDMVTIDSRDYNIVNVNKVQLQGGNVIYEAQCR